MQAIHLAAMDMDGTLLDDRKEVSPATLRALEALREKGIPAAFSTGRALSEVTLYPELTGLIPYAILASGALVMDLRAGTVISKNTLTTEVALKALELASREDVVPHLLTVYAILADGSKWYHTQDVSAQMDEVTITPIEEKVVNIEIEELPIPKPIVNGSGFQPTIDGWQGIEIEVGM